jgi:hypothetical protein
MPPARGLFLAWVESSSKQSNARAGGIQGRVGLAQVR